MRYDYIIIGGGMSGLYFNYKLHQKDITNVLLLEKEDRLGGRSISLKFKDATIQAGTGIGIANRDHTLLKLLNELDIEYNTFTIGLDNNECLDILAKLYKNIHTLKPNMSFEEYCKLVLSKDEIYILSKEAGYTDFNDANALMTLNYYGLESNYKRYIGVGINWTKLVDKLSEYLKNYKTSCEVLSIEENIVKTNKGYYKCKNVVIASTISTIQKLTNDPMYQQIIQSHPFMRIYASFEDDRSKKIMNTKFKSFTHTYNKLHFISRFSENVFMVAYTDGDDAISLYNEIMNSNNKKQVVEKYLQCSVLQRSVIQRSIDRDKTIKIKIEEMRIFYWNEAVHQYKTSDINFSVLRNPKKGMYVVGEAVAHIQGWTEGALQSVDSLFNE